MPTPKPEDYILRLSTALGLRPITLKTAYDIVNDFCSNKIHIGSDPSGVAATSVYLASIINSENVTQERVGRLAHITEITIRNNIKKLIRALPDNYMKMGYIKNGSAHTLEENLL